MKIYKKSCPEFFAVVLIFAFSSCDNNTAGQSINADSAKISVKQKAKVSIVKEVSFDTAD